MNESTEIMLTAKQLKARFGGVSDMTIHRWLSDDGLKFPRPFYIKKLRYWRLSKLVEWERARVNAA